VLKGLRTAETAMNVQLTRTNALANNLANVNTTGFKRMLTQVLEEESGAQTPDLPQTRDLPPNTLREAMPRDLVLGVRAPIDLSQGALTPTGNPLDVAVRGEGLFKVRRDGQDFYTRNGAFTLNETRQLVTSAGDLVQGAGGTIQLPEGDVSIGPDGTVSVDGAEIDRLALHDFGEPGLLVHVGNSLMSADGGAGARAVPAEETEIVQGVLEGSNVDPIQTLVGMIAAQRAFEMSSKVLQSEDQSLDKTVNKLSGQA